MDTNEIEAKSILSESGLYDTDYSINPYRGCSHACVYCYAPYVLREKRPWGTFVDVKINAPKILKRELRKIKKGKILISSVTDPYQSLEKEYKITRRLLEILVGRKFSVSILTKSSLVLRDLDLLKKLDSEIGLTISTLDENFSKIFEPNASPPKERLEALSYLKISGLKTYIFFGPLLPFISDIDLEKTLRRFSETKVDFIIVDRLNVKGRNNWERLKEVLEINYPDLVDKWKKILLKNNDYYDKLKERIKILCKENDLKCEFCY